MGVLDAIRAYALPGGSVPPGSNGPPGGGSVGGDGLLGGDTDLCGSGSGSGGDSGPCGGNIWGGLLGGVSGGGGFIIGFGLRAAGQTGVGFIPLSLLYLPSRNLATKSSAEGRGERTRRESTPRLRSVTKNCVRRPLLDRLDGKISPRLVMCPGVFPSALDEAVLASALHDAIELAPVVVERSWNTPLLRPGEFRAAQGTRRTRGGRPLPSDGGGHSLWRDKEGFAT